MSGRRTPVRALGGIGLAQRLAAAAIRVLVRATTRIEVEGGATLPRTGPLIVVANHTSNVDPPLVEAWLQPRLGRPIQFMAKEQLFVPLLRPILRWYGSILVRAGGSDVEAYRDGLALLRQGGVLGVFPEGTRSADGRLGEAHQGVALLALRSGAPVLPVGISGLDGYLPRGARRPRLGTRVTMRIGEPFTLVLDPRLARRAAVIDATGTLMARLASLVDARHRGRHGREA